MFTSLPFFLIFQNCCIHYRLYPGGIPGTGIPSYNAVLRVRCVLREHGILYFYRPVGVLILRPNEREKTTPRPPGVKHSLKKPGRKGVTGMENPFQPNRSKFSSLLFDCNRFWISLYCIKAILSACRNTQKYSQRDGRRKAGC